VLSIEYTDDQILFTLKPGGLQDMINYIAETAFAFCVKCELICFHREDTINKEQSPCY